MMLARALLTFSIISISGFAELQTPTVAIIGGGLAGLTTAYRLQQQGIAAHVYEAKKRVGGRVFTAKIGSDFVELGGQNVSDGGEAKHLCQLCDEFDLPLYTYRCFHLGRNLRYFDGTSLMPIRPFEKVDPEQLQSQLTEIAARSDTMQDVFNALFSKKDSLYKTLALRLSAFEGAPIDKLSSYYVRTLYYMLLQGVCSAYLPIEEEDELAIDIVSIQGGNSLLPMRLAHCLGDHIHLNMPLIKVIKGQDHAYTLIFQNGEVVQANILVLAIPCSVYEDIIFEENLIPETTLTAIKNVRYGTNAKILVPLSKIPKKPLGLLNDRIGCYFSGSPILTLYFTGDAGRFSKTSIHDAYQQEYPMLACGFGNLCPPFATPAFAQDALFLSYAGPVGYSWPNDPYAKGSYSYIAPGQETTLTSTQDHNGDIVRTLFAPIDETLFFAGEHASILFDVPGTMEAACESGDKAAQMTAKSLTKLPKRRI